MPGKCWYQEAQTHKLAVGGSQLESPHLTFNHTVLCISVLFSLVMFTERPNFARLLLKLDSTSAQVRLCLTFPLPPPQNIKPCAHGITAEKASGQSTKIHMCVVEEADQSRGVRGWSTFPFSPLDMFTLWTLGCCWSSIFIYDIGVQSTMPQKHLFLNFPKSINCHIFFRATLWERNIILGVGLYSLLCYWGVIWPLIELSCCSAKYLYFKFIICTFLTQSTTIFAFSVKMWIAITYSWLHCLSPVFPLILEICIHEWLQ